jgi:hypothetical protein
VDKGDIMQEDHFTLNPKGFSKIEIFIVCAIIILLMVLVFASLNSIVIKFKIKADYNTAMEVERGIKLFITQTGVSNLLASDVFRDDPQKKTFQITPNKEGVMLLIEKLQKPIYMRDKRTGVTKSYGPYLLSQNGTYAYENYAPTWSLENSGKHIGYHIELWPSSLQVKVTPITDESVFKITVR